MLYLLYVCLEPRMLGRKTLAARPKQQDPSSQNQAVISDNKANPEINGFAAAGCTMVTLYGSTQQHPAPLFVSRPLKGFITLNHSPHLIVCADSLALCCLSCGLRHSQPAADLSLGGMWTPFLDALSAACAHAERLFAICVGRRSPIMGPC